jgi:UDP-glucose 4-epimerase
MRILFTGGSSFTGLWFIRELALAGHNVTATFRQRPEDYPDELRQRRATLAAGSCRAAYGISFGDAAFMELVRTGGWDLLAHHAADVTNYRSPDFDVAEALRNNTHQVRPVLDALLAGGCSRVLLTGSVFEGGEGAGSGGLPDFSSYGLSKALTAQVFRHHCGRAGLALGKFVVPNPFGPHEESRYTAYLLKSWLAGATPTCASPAYVRDNIHVSLLARAYVRFAERLPDEPTFIRTNPSGYVESQGAFTRRVAEAMRPRLGMPCLVEMETQTEFPEPAVRINTDVVDGRALGWSESAAWDDMARYYQPPDPN